MVLLRAPCRKSRSVVIPAYVRCTKDVRLAHFCHHTCPQFQARLRNSHPMCRDREFTFVNLSDPPQQQSDPRVRKLVRSHVTRVGHVRRRGENLISSEQCSRPIKLNHIDAWKSSDLGKERTQVISKPAKPEKAV